MKDVFARRSTEFDIVLNDTEYEFFKYLEHFDPTHHDRTHKIIGGTFIEHSKNYPQKGVDIIIAKHHHALKHLYKKSNLHQKSDENTNSNDYLTDNNGSDYAESELCRTKEKKNVTPIYYKEDGRWNLILQNEEIRQVIDWFECDETGES